MGNSRGSAGNFCADERGLGLAVAEIETEANILRRREDDGELARVSERNKAIVDGGGCARHGFVDFAKQIKGERAEGFRLREHIRDRFRGGAE